jgi:hypothetical protein
MTASHELSAPGHATTSRVPLIWGLCVVDAALILVSGAIHFHLWRGPYRHLTVGHINDLFLLQVIGCLVIAIAILATRHILTVLAGAALMAGTFIGFLISRYRTAGLFGWHDPYTTSDSNWALAVEIAGTVLLLATAWVLSRSSRPAS